MPHRGTQKLCRVIGESPLHLEQQFRPEHNRSPRSLGNSPGLGIVAHRVRRDGFGNAAVFSVTYKGGVFRYLTLSWGIVFRLGAFRELWASCRV
jgi:hypothetical protein